MADGTPESARNSLLVWSGRGELGVIDAPTDRLVRPGLRVGRRAPATLGVAIGAVLLAGSATALHGVGNPAGVQLVGAAHAATVTRHSAPAHAITAGFRLETGDVVATGQNGGVTLDAGANRLFVGPSSSVVIDSPDRWTLRSGQVGIARSSAAGTAVPTVLAGADSVVAAPGSGVRIQRAGTVQAAALRGTASVLAAGQTVHLATLREVNLQGDAVATPQLVQSLDDSADGVDAQLAPELVALDTALSRLATQVGADPRAAELFGTGPLSAGDVALEDALRRLAGPQLALVSAVSTGKIAWGILAAQAGANDAQVRAYVGAVLDGTAPAPTSQPVLGTTTGPAPYVAAAASPATSGTSSAPDRDGSSTPPTRDSGGNGGDSGATQAPPAPIASATTPPAVADSPTPPAPTTDAPTTDAPTTDAPTTDAPSTDAPTTDPATTAPPADVQPGDSGTDAQSAPQATDAAAAAGPLGMLVVLARGVRGPASSPSPTPTPRPRSTPSPTPRPTTKAAAPRPAPTRSTVPATPRGTVPAPRKPLPPSKKAVPTKAPTVHPTTPPAVHGTTTVPTTRAPLVAVPTTAPKPAVTKAPTSSAVPTKAAASPTPKPGPIATLLCPVLGAGSLCGRDRVS